MEQTSGEPQQKEHIPTHLKCPRCNSLDTKFRYYNNNSLTQPRYSCRTCKRQWTAGGNLRNIPIGGKSKSGKQTKDSSSRCDDSICPPLQPFGEQHLQISQSLEPMAGVVSQNFHTTMTKQTTNLPPPVFPEGSCYFNDEISCLDVIQSLIQPEPINQHVNVVNQFCSGGASIEIPQEWNIQPMPSQQAFHQQIPGYIEPHQTYNQVNSWPTSHLYNNSLVQPTWPMSSLARDIPTNFDVPTSNTSLRNNNFRGDTTDAEMETNFVDVDEWLNFSEESS